MEKYNMITVELLFIYQKDQRYLLKWKKLERNYTLMVIMLSSPEAFIEWKKSISHFSLYMVIQDLSEILIALPMQQKKKSAY